MAPPGGQPKGGAQAAPQRVQGQPERGKKRERGLQRRGHNYLVNFAAKMFRSRFLDKQVSLQQLCQLQFQLRLQATRLRTHTIAICTAFKTAPFSNSSPDTHSMFNAQLKPHPAYLRPHLSPPRRARILLLCGSSASSKPGALAKTSRACSTDTNVYLGAHGRHQRAR